MSEGCPGILLTTLRSTDIWFCPTPPLLQTRHFLPEVLSPPGACREASPVTPWVSLFPPDRQPGSRGSECVCVSSCHPPHPCCEGPKGTITFYPLLGPEIVA